MPSARMDPDGALSFGADYFLNTQRYDLGFQATPWLSVRFEYSGLEHFDPTYPVYWDRSFAAKIRLWDETATTPAISVGATDLVGTGLFSGEYFVASKQFGNFDTTLGLGWGSLGSTGSFRNPIISISRSFEKRPLGLTPGGTDFSVLFHGPTVGLFGGVIWRTPIDGLSLTAEYSSDAYTLQQQRGNFKPVNQLNYAVTYELSDSTELSLAWLYGRSIGGEISFELDPTTGPFPHRIGPAIPPPPASRTAKQQQEALNAMLLDRGGLRIPDTRSSGVLVDALWNSTPGIIDASIHGSSLSISSSNGDLEAVCMRAAGVVGLHSSTFETVQVSNGRNHATCAVPVTPLLVLATPHQSYSYPGVDLARLSALSDVLTIDASSVSPDATAVASRIKVDAAQQKLDIAAVNVAHSEALVYYTNNTYFSEQDALDRLLRVTMKDLPPEVEKMRFIAMNGAIPLREFDVLRAPVERNIDQTGSPNLSSAMSSRPAPIQNPILSAAEQTDFPRYSWDLFPQFRQELFDPNNPFGVQFIGALSGSAELLPGFSLNGEVEGNIWDNFNTSRPAESVLPHVRTDFNQYFTKGKNGIGYLQANYLFRFAPDVFAIAKAGYLENMFAGAGGEVLWRPEGLRWALGIDGYEVQQRDYSRLFGLQPYSAFTGHLSLYYASPWYGLNFVVRAGQYLAKDRGFTFQITRRFSTGVEIGAFFTRTNVSAAQFGEGSFDKGIIITIPIGWTLPIDSQNQLTTVLRPVQRDGGQELLGDAVLYEITRRTSEAEFELEDGNP